MLIQNDELQVMRYQLNLKIPTFLLVIESESIQISLSNK